MVDAGSSTITSEDRTVEDARAAIVRILSDGSSKNLTSISTELQMTSEGFLDLNYVKKLCEDLVSGKAETNSGRRILRKIQSRSARISRVARDPVPDWSSAVSSAQR